VSGQLHVRATLPPENETLDSVEYGAVCNSYLVRTPGSKDIFLASAENLTPAIQSVARRYTD
jgi:hypothetical protein